MRIAIFSALYKPSIGGVENYTEQISKALVNLGHEVTIVTHLLDRSAGWEQNGRAAIVRIPCFPLLNKRLPVPKLGHELLHSLKKLDSLSFDAVLINTRFYPLSLIGARFAMRKSITPLVLEHGSAHLTLGNSLVDTFIKAYEHVMTALLNRNRPVFYGVSSSSCQWLHHFHIDAAGTLPNAINTSDWLEQASTRSFLKEYPTAQGAAAISFVGRLVPEKGIEPLIDAMGILYDSHFQATLFVAGDGPLKERLETKKTPNVVFLGPLSKNDVAALLNQSDLYCLPSRSEGFATSLLEASASGTPSLVTDVGGVAELIPNNSYGWVLESTDPGQIAQDIKTALADKAELKHKGSLVRSLVEQNYNWPTTARKLIAAFHSLQN